ncbi:MAG: hypothetical protein NTV03_00030, partial [Candidatus Nomurabacteria bacterium]|nr:hypothetical protein [Candidatus Nomurabacteria bacterium]
NLIEFLSINGEDLGQDDKDVIYYIYNDKLLKAVHNISKKNAKISLKMNKIGQGSVFPETEIYFGESEFSKIKFVLDNITNPEKVMGGIQKRRNFVYKGCELAIKWSKEWGYHFEIEKVVNDKDLIDDIERELEQITSELNIKIMTEDELTEFTQKAEENAKKKL